FAVNKDIAYTPRIGNLSKGLQSHYSLRDIMSNPKRTVKLQYGTRDYQGFKAKEERTLNYVSPQGEKILHKELKIPDFPDAVVTLEAYKSFKKIPEASAKYEDERGFLICSKGAIHDVYNFGF